MEGRCWERVKGEMAPRPPGPHASGTDCRRTPEEEAGTSSDACVSCVLSP